MNDLVNFQQPEMAKALIENTENFNATTEAGGGFFLKMEQKSGDWVYGAEDELADPESLWAINPASVELGYVCWHRQQLIGRHARPVHEPPVTLAELPPLDHGQEWKPMKKITLVCIEGQNEGVEVTYETSSLGGRRAITGVTDGVIARLKQGDPDIVPVVKLESYTYKNKEGGLTRNPVFKITAWCDGINKPLSDLPVLEEEPAIKPRARSRSRG